MEDLTPMLLQFPAAPVVEAAPAALVAPVMHLAANAPHFMPTEILEYDNVKGDFVVVALTPQELIELDYAATSNEDLEELGLNVLELLDEGESDE